MTFQVDIFLASVFCILISSCLSGVIIGLTPLKKEDLQLEVSSKVVPTRYQQNKEQLKLPPGKKPPCFQLGRSVSSPLFQQPWRRKHSHHTIWAGLWLLQYFYRKEFLAHRCLLEKKNFGKYRSSRLLFCRLVHTLPSHKARPISQIFYCRVTWCRWVTDQCTYGIAIYCRCATEELTLFGPVDGSIAGCGRQVRSITEGLGQLLENAGMFSIFSIW